MKNADIISKLTLEQKAGFCSGKDSWHLRSVEEAGLPEIMMTDGPHGLRKQPRKGDISGIGGSVPATCFLPACTTAASWDTAMLYRMGQALGEEALQEKVSIVLGPGVNIKRNPLCGRNFEYFSEDPYLAGKLAANFIKGVQSTGTGTCIKHFAANNQETRRQTIDSVVDERTLREIYLTAFEIAVKEAKPWAVMNAYNKLNGTYCAENKYLLTDILRDEWGFDGIVMSDWGAENNRVKGLKAGGNLEMPSSNGINDKKIIKAIENGELDESELDESIDKVIDIIIKSKHNLSKTHNYDKLKHHRLVRTMAANSVVLLKNENAVLPLKKGDKVAIIGEMAKKARFQGAGSSFIEPTILESAYDIYKAEYGFEPKYEQGYKTDTDVIDEELESAAVELAERDKDRKIIMYVGLTDLYESEAFDREHMRLPENQLSLIEKVCAVNENVIIVLSCGSPVEMPFEKDVKAILCSYLGGQAGAGAVLDILYGKTNPSGKLPETFPLKYEDVPSAKYFPEGPETVEYREGIYVGYRYFDSADVPVLYPFGYGLSYTTFEFSDLKLSSENIRDDDKLTVTFKVKNTGETDGAEVCQLYIGANENKIYRPKKELRAFTKIYLKAGEEKSVSFTLGKREFSYYNVDSKSFEAETGRYTVYVGNSLVDLPLQKIVKVTNVEGIKPINYTQATPHYFEAKVNEVTDSEFETLLGRELPPKQKGEDFVPSVDMPLIDMTDYAGGRFLNKFAYKVTMLVVKGTITNRKMAATMLLSTPVRASVMMSGGALTLQMGKDIVRMGTGHFCSGLLKFLFHAIVRTKKANDD